MTVPPLAGRLFRSFVACVPFAAIAAGAPLDEQATQLDAEVQALKAEAIDINQTGLGIEERFLYPERTRLFVYVGVKPPGLLVDVVRVQIDNAPATEHKCSVEESYGLQRKGLLRVVRGNAERGTHRLRAEITARYADAKPDTAPYRLTIEETFDKGAEPSYLELSLFLQGFDNTPHLRLRDWKPAK